MSSRCLPSVVVQWSPIPLILLVVYVLWPLSLFEILVTFPGVPILYSYETLRYDESPRYERFRERATYGVLPWLGVGYLLHMGAIFVFLYVAHLVVPDPGTLVFNVLLYLPLMFAFVVPPAVVRIAGFVHRPTL
ncbi:hypothetical protein U3A55_11425 [Salarchaeum sp. III]|uniref:hypothetical protein n=1 Tax=Salarchaeum sp. III TaxID=3107927 RepID=UPI002EDAAD63